MTEEKEPQAEEVRWETIPPEIQTALITQLTTLLIQAMEETTDE